MQEFCLSVLMFVTVVLFIGTVARAETVAAADASRNPEIYTPDQEAVVTDALGVRIGRVRRLPGHRLPRPDDEFDHAPRDVSVLNDRVTLTLDGFDEPDSRRYEPGRYALSDTRIPAFRNNIAAKSQERRARLRMNILDTDMARINLAGEYFDRIVPRTQDMTTLSLADGSIYEDNEVGRLEVHLGFLNDRLRYQGRASRSRYVGVGGFWFDPGQDFTVLGDEAGAFYTASEGAEWWQRIDADLIAGDRLSLSAHAEIGAGDPGFHTSEFERFGADYTGRHTLVGVQAGFDRYRTHLWQRQHESDYSSEDEIGMRIDFGVGAVDASRTRRVTLPSDLGQAGGLLGFGGLSGEQSFEALGSELFGTEDDWFFVAPPAPAWHEREATVAGAFELRPQQIFGIDPYGYQFGIGMLVPTTVTLRGQRTRTAFPDDRSEPSGPEDVEKTFGVDISWETATSSTSIGLARALTDSRQLFLESADETEHMVDFTQDFYTDRWSLTAYLSYAHARNRESDNRSKSLVLSGGPDFTLYAVGLPEITFSVGIDRGDYQFIDLGDSFRSDSWNTGIEIDFSNFLAGFDAQSGTRPSFIFGYRAEGTRDRDTYDSPETKIDHGVYVLGNFRF